MELSNSWLWSSELQNSNLLLLELNSNKASCRYPVEKSDSRCESNGGVLVLMLLSRTMPKRKKIKNELRQCRKRRLKKKKKEERRKKSCYIEACLRWKLQDCGSPNLEKSCVGCCKQWSEGHPSFREVELGGWWEMCSRSVLGYKSFCKKIKNKKGAQE